MQKYEIKVHNVFRFEVCFNWIDVSDVRLSVNMFFYSKIPLPFPNSSYLLDPSNPMAKAEMRFLRLYNNLNQAIGLQ